MLSTIAGYLLMTLGMPVAFGGIVMALVASVVGNSQLIDYVICIYVAVLYITAIIIYYDKSINKIFLALEYLLLIAPLPLWYIISKGAANNGITNQVFEPSSIIFITLIICVLNKFVNRNSVYSYLLKPYLIPLAYTFFIRAFAPYIGK